jgi:hypothetical protein
MEDQTMKVAVCKGGTNITFSKSNRSAACADILYALRQLDPKIIDTTIVTHKTRNTVIPKPLKFTEIEEVNFDDFDLVLLFNFSINFFGGVEDKNLLNLYRKMAKTLTPIVYIQTDGQLSFKQLWPAICNREWASEYKESEFFIEPSNVIYISQGQDLLKVRQEINKKDDNIRPSGILHYPWAQTILAGTTTAKYQKSINFADRPYDLAFGGATRNAHKLRKIKHYFMEPQHSNLIFGNIRNLPDKPNIEYTKAVSYQQFIPTMQKAKGTVIIGDKHYEDNYFTLRMYESIIAGCMTYIDVYLDTHHNFYQNKFDELYVSSPSHILEFNRYAEELSKESNLFILNNYDEVKSRDQLYESLKACTE